MQIWLFYIARERNDTCNQARKIVHVEASDSKPSLHSIARFKTESPRFPHTVLHNTYFMRPLNRVQMSRIKTIMIIVCDTFIIAVCYDILNIIPRSDRDEKGKSIFVFHVSKILIAVGLKPWWIGCFRSVKTIFTIMQSTAPLESLSNNTSDSEHFCESVIDH